MPPEEKDSPFMKLSGGFGIGSGIGGNFVTPAPLLNLAFIMLDRLAQFRDDFEPGQPFYETLADLCAPRGTVINRAARAYFRKIPTAIQEALRATIYHALGTYPPTPITFAWVPSYDWEMTIWQASDAEETAGAITILIKSRYLDDTHPLD